MENLTEVLLPFGNVTVTVLGLVLLYGLLTGVYQLGIIGFSFLLAFDCEDAPDVKFKNKLYELVKYSCWFVIKPEDLVKNVYGGWAVLSSASNSGRVRYFGKNNIEFSYCSEHCIKEYSLYTTKEEALYFATEVVNEVRYTWVTGLIKVLKPLLILDIIILMLSIQFLPTIILCGTVLVVIGVRTLAKVVYKNTKRIDVTEGRVTKLEER